MSEQNIWNNTYVLGDVSATTLSAGNGIKITTDEPGVIKVSNDETVLWSGTKTWWNDTSELTLSGNISDYESFKVVYSDDWELRPIIKEFPGDNTSFDASLFGAEGNNLTFKTSKFNVNGNKINIDKNRTIEVNSAGNISTVIFTTSYIKFSKIIGCNRKQNGGN